MKRNLLLAAPAAGGAALALAAWQYAPAQPGIDAEALFKDRCATCHEPAVERATARASRAIGGRGE